MKIMSINLLYRKHAATDDRPRGWAYHGRTKPDWGCRGQLFAQDLKANP